jgi:hypothetical protein
VIQECRNSDIPEFGGMPFAVEKDESLGPMDVRFLRPPAVVPAPYRITQSIQEAGAGGFI